MVIWVIGGGELIRDLGVWPWCFGSVVAETLNPIEEEDEEEEETTTTTKSRCVNATNNYEPWLAKFGFFILFYCF